MSFNWSFCLTHYDLSQALNKENYSFKKAHLKCLLSGMHTLPPPRTPNPPVFFYVRQDLLIATSLYFLTKNEKWTMNLIKTRGYQDRCPCKYNLITQKCAKMIKQSLSFVVSVILSGVETLKYPRFHGIFFFDKIFTFFNLVSDFFSNWNFSKNEV